MKKIFIPKELHVGFQERLDTYTGQLAYVIYKDEKGTLRKEKSWNSWRDETIEPLITENEPLSGFVLNKKAGGYSSGWNHRQAYIRVYDPRGFEIEITIENLLYILENTSSIKGKGLEGEFVYGWDGKDLILIPISSPDYKEIERYSKLIYKEDKIKAKDLKVGATYLTKQNQKAIYLGKFDYHPNILKSGEKHYFCFIETTKSNGRKLSIEIISNISSTLLSLEDSEVSNYLNKAMELLEITPQYSPATDQKFFQYTEEKLIEFLKNYEWNMHVYMGEEHNKYFIHREKEDIIFQKSSSYQFGYGEEFKVKVEDISKLIKQKNICYCINYHANGFEYNSSDTKINKVIRKKRVELILV